MCSSGTLASSRHLRFRVAIAGVHRRCVQITSQRALPFPAKAFLPIVCSRTSRAPTGPCGAVPLFPSRKAAAVALSVGISMQVGRRQSRSPKTVLASRSQMISRALQSERGRRGTKRLFEAFRGGFPAREGSSAFPPCNRDKRSTFCQPRHGHRRKAAVVRNKDDPVSSAAATAHLTSLARGSRPNPL